MHGRKVVFASGCGALILGATALLGWAYGSIRMTSVVPGLASMKPTTALAAAMAGVALMGASLRVRPLVVRSLAALVVGTGLVAIVEYRAGIETGMAGLWWLDASGVVDQPHPLRMSEMTAYGLVLAGMGIISATYAAMWRLTCVAALSVGSIAGVALVGYTYGVEALYAVGPFSSIALNTALVLGALAVGLTWSVPEKGLARLVSMSSMGGRTARVLLPVALLLPVVLGSIRLEGIRRSWYPMEFGVALFAVVGMAVFGGLIWWYGSWLDRTESQRKAMEDQLYQSQKMEAVGRLASGIAHDFNNVLTAVLNTAEMAREDLPSDHPVQEDLDTIYSSGERASALVRQLLAFCRGQVLDPDLVSVGELVRGSQPILERIVGPDVELQVLIGDDEKRVLADPSRIEQVLVNLVINACDAMEGSGRVTVETRVVSVSADLASRTPGASAGDHVALLVTDTGPGIPPEVRRNMFDPFFTTKPFGEGTGLGLSTSYGIVRQTGGHITVDTERGSGTSFRVFIPVAEAKPQVLVERACPPDETTDGPVVVLVIEHDVAVLRAMAEILTRAGYKALKAQGSEVALELLAAHRDGIDLVVIDAGMPGMDTDEHLDAIWASNRGVQVVCTAGYSDLSLRQAALVERGVHMLEKPFGPAPLLAVVKRALTDASCREADRDTA